MNIVFNTSHVNEGLRERSLGRSATRDSKISAVSSKWIVVTSINYPTEDIERLVETGWDLVVVADKKTPSDWHLERVHFLSIEKQVELELELPRRLPYGTYTRKNVGYLYAIMNGAEWIYDTDDDNKPYGLGLNQFDYEETTSGIRFQEVKNSSLKLNVFNPYSYFGNSNMWPRGFPLEMLNNHTNSNDRMVSCRKMRTPAVQQGLVHKDPDVDAIYRLLHADETGLNETFDKYAPPVTLEQGTYSPWNSQNTLFNKKAFFRMFLPTTVEFRVTDIWRSYFSQKLLHLIGETIAFYPANAIQIRNAHNYLEDFEDERAVYLKSGEIIKTLSKWECQANTTENCTLELAQLFSDLAYWDESELLLIRDWISDLKNIGYEFPPLVNNIDSYAASEDRNANCIRVHMDFSRSSESKTYEKRRENIEDMIGFCEKKTNISFNISMVNEIKVKQEQNSGINQKKNTALVITANWPWKSGMGVLQRLYEPYFAVTIFCGTWNQTHYVSNGPFPSTMPFNYIHLSQKQMVGGVFMYYCLSKARDLKLQNIEGYYIVADDTLFNIWTDIAQDKVVLPDGICKTNSFHWDGSYGKVAANRLVYDLVYKKYANSSEVQTVWRKYDQFSWKALNQSGVHTMTNFTYRSASDMFYVPSTHVDFFALMFELMSEAGLFLEIAVAKLMHVIDYKNYAAKTAFLWDGGSRDAYHKFYNSSVLMVHPIKMGVAGQNAATITQFCNSVVRTFIESIF